MIWRSPWRGSEEAMRGTYGVGEGRLSKAVEDLRLAAKRVEAAKREIGREWVRHGKLDAEGAVLESLLKDVAAVHRVVQMTWGDVLQSMDRFERPFGEMFDEKKLDISN